MQIIIKGRTGTGKTSLAVLIQELLQTLRIQAPIKETPEDIMPYSLAHANKCVKNIPQPVAISIGKSMHSGPSAEVIIIDTDERQALAMACWLQTGLIDFCVPTTIFTDKYLNPPSDPVSDTVMRMRGPINISTEQVKSCCLPPTDYALKAAVSEVCKKHGLNDDFASELVESLKAFVPVMQAQLRHELRETGIARHVIPGGLS